MSQTRNSVAAILVNWNSSLNALRCVQSLRCSSADRDLNVIIVDNDSRPSERQLLREGTGFTLLEAGANLGFAAGCNLGAKHSQESCLLFINPDAIAIDNAVEQLACWLDSNPEAAGVAGLLLDRRGRPDVDFVIRRLPSLLSVMYDAVFLDLIITDSVKKRRWRSMLVSGEAGAVEQPPGACLMIRRSVFECIGGFDEAFYPAWYEDVDLCRKIKDSGRRLYLLPTAHFEHSGHASLTEFAWSDFLALFNQNQRRYFEKYYSKAPVWAFRILVSLGMVLRLAAIPIVWDKRAGCRHEAALSYLRVIAIMISRKPDCLRSPGKC